MFLYGTHDNNQCQKNVFLKNENTVPQKFLNFSKSLPLQLLDQKFLLPGET